MMELFELLGDVRRGGGIPDVRIDLALEGDANAHGLERAVMDVRGIIARPRATSLRTSSGSIFSRRATYAISSVITPFRA